MQPATQEYTPNPIMHEQYDAMLMSLSAIALMASHPYLYWRSCDTLAKSPANDESTRKMFQDSSARCEAQMRRVCELLDEVMQYLGARNNGVDAVDEHGMTDAAFAAMNRALGRDKPKSDEPG